jgi:hypothetical protein
MRARHLWDPAPLLEGHPDVTFELLDDMRQSYRRFAVGNTYEGAKPPCRTAILCPYRDSSYERERGEENMTVRLPRSNKPPPAGAGGWEGAQPREEEIARALVCLSSVYDKLHDLPIVTRAHVPR